MHVVRRVRHAHVHGPRASAPPRARTHRRGAAERCRYFLAHFYFFLSPAFGLGTPVMCYRLLAGGAARRRHERRRRLRGGTAGGCLARRRLLVLALALHGLFVRALYNIVRVNTAIVDAFGGGRGGGGRGGSRNGCGDDVEDEGAEHELPPTPRASSCGSGGSSSCSSRRVRAMRAVAIVHHVGGHPVHEGRRQGRES